MKVEVENTDCDEVCEAFPDSFWVATVLRISGYRALLRYEGFGHHDDRDFWVSLCSNDIHPVGWCATIGKPLIPPNSKLTLIIRAFRIIKLQVTQYFSQYLKFCNFERWKWQWFFFVDRTQILKKSVQSFWISFDITWYDTYW